MRTLLPTLLVVAATAAACTTVSTGQPPDGAAIASVQPAQPVEPSPTAGVSADEPPTGGVSLPTDTVVTAPPMTGPVAVELLATADGPVRFAPVWDDPSSADELAAVVAASEEALRDASLPDSERAAAAHRAQRAYRQLGRTPAWRDDVLTALPERWRASTRANLAARDALESLRASGPPPETLPAWEIVAPDPADELLGHYRDAGEALGVDWELLAAINLVETRMGRIVGFSTAGARGPMQFIPASWEAFGAGGDIDDTRDSIFAAARHLTQRPGSPPSDRAALFNYNNHDAYGEAVLAYAGVLRDDPAAYLGYHGWQVYYSTPQAEFLLPVGYREEQPVPITTYLDRPVLPVAG